MADENSNENMAGALDLSGLGSFDFTPAWAKGSPDDKSKFARFEAREERPAREDRGPRRERDERGPRREERGSRPAFGGPRRERDDRGPRRERDDRGPRRDDRGPRSSFGGPRREERAPRPFVKPLEVDVRILPSQKDLGVIIRKIQTSHLAYPVKRLANFFLEHPEACMLRLTPKAGTEIHFHQCKSCGYVAFSEEDLLSHVLTVHLSDYYDIEEIDCEPPKGAFSCVAKCGLSGVLLGPPNLHGYEAKIREMLRTRFPSMSEAEYRSRIEMVRDPEAVEEWRKTATKKTVYRRKPVKDAAVGDAAEIPAVEREMAELEFRRLIAPGLLSAPKTVDLTAEVALKSPSLPLVFACRDALSWERKRPRNLIRALHGAFHNRKLEFFRANDPEGPEFVTAVKPAALDVEHAVPELAALVKYVGEHPDLQQQVLIDTLAAGDAAKVNELKLHLAWLIEKGYLVGYFNGQVVSPATHPRYNPPRNGHPPKVAEAPAAETVPAAPEA